MGEVFNRDELTNMWKKQQSAISKELNQLGYTTSSAYCNDDNILLFYRDSTNAEIIFGISQDATGDVLLGNVVVFDDGPTLVYNSILKGITHSSGELLKGIKAIEREVDENYSKDYISNKMRLVERFKSPHEIIQGFTNLSKGRKKDELTY